MPRATHAAEAEERGSRAFRALTRASRCFGGGRQTKLHSTHAAGFTLAELLIVVAIIAVLVGIAIPVFTSQLERSREAVDLSCVRSAYTEVMVAALTDDRTATCNGAQIYQEGSGSGSSATWKATVELSQQRDEWQTDKSKLNIGGVSSSDSTHWVGEPKADGTCVITYTEADGLTLIWSGGSESGKDDEPTGSSGIFQEIASSDNVIPFEVDPTKGITLTAGSVFSYNGRYYVCIANTTAGAGWSDYSSVTPDGNKWPYIELKSDAAILTSEQISYDNDGSQYGHFNGALQGNIYKADDGKLYILKCDYNDGSWCSPPEAGNSNWQEINYSTSS